MSKLSPYVKRPNNAQSNKMNSARVSDNIRGTRYIQNVSSHKNNRDQHSTPKPTQKKRGGDSIDMVNLMDNNRVLTAQNEQLYQMLEERGHIVTALERKLQDQIKREAATLDAIEHEKNKFIGDSHKKFKDYDCKIEELIQEICLLRGQKQQGLRNEQLDLARMSIRKKQHSPKINPHTLPREHLQLQLLKITNLLQMKNNQMEQLQLQLRTSSDNLKDEIIGLNNQIVHLNQLHRMELSDQKIDFQRVIDGLRNEFQKQKEVLTMEHDVQFKQMQKLLDAKNMQSTRVGQQKKMGEIQQSIRENQLLEQKFSLENQLRQLQDFYRQRKVNEDVKFKELNQNQLEAMSVGNKATVGNLKAENTKLLQLIDSKSQEIKTLYSQMAEQHAQHCQEVQRLELLIAQLKGSVQTSVRDHGQEDERVKVKWAELRQADLKALSGYYQNQIDVLNQRLLQKIQESDSNRQKLHGQLQEKSEMRKVFDIEILRLSSRVAELQLKANQLTVNKREEVLDISSQKSMTAIMLSRETKERQKLNQLSEDEKRKLQQLILGKDKQIENLNSRIELLKDSAGKEIVQKNYEIELMRKGKDNLQVQLQKQKLFFQKELQRKEAVIRENRVNYEQHLVRMKQSSREEYDNAIGQLSGQKVALQVELNRLRVIQKNLRSELGTLQKHKEEELVNKQEQLSEEKHKLTSNKRQAEDSLKKYYTKQIQKLQIQIGELKVQLRYKEEDLRKQGEKYSQLQHKLQEVFSSQEKLRNMENMIIEMGQDNNLVKNLAEVIKPRR